MTSPQPTSEPDADDYGVLYEDQVAPEYGILGLTLRELLIVAVWALAFILSFFPVFGDLISVWQLGLAWILPVGVPSVAVFLIVLRRFSPDGIRRVGSLGIDQFASVAFSVSAVYWLQHVWLEVLEAVGSGTVRLSWVAIAQLALALALVTLTVAAPLIPGLREDFEGRMETLAHRNANPVRPVVARPRPVRTPATDSDARAVDSVATVADSDAPPTESDVPEAGAEPAPEVDPVPQPETEQAGEGTPQTAPETEAAPATRSEARSARQAEPRDDETDQEEAMAETIVISEDMPSAARDDDSTDRPDGQPFWILAGSARDVHDDRGEPVFRIGPEAWTLVIEDRDGAYVVRHDDGRIGYLHDITDITKG